MEAAITAIGNAVPIYKEAQSRIFELMANRLDLNRGQRRILKKIYNEAGIEYRNSVLPDFVEKEKERIIFHNDLGEFFPSTQKRMEVYKNNALSLALAAIKDCCSSLRNFNLSNITHLITVSCTGMSAPGLDIELVQHLGLFGNVQRTTVNFMGCYGVFNGLKVANAICRADEDAKVLLVSVEICTLHFQKDSSLDSFISSTIFSDGAGAALIEGNRCHDRCLIMKDFYCDLLPESDREMTWDIGNQGFNIRLSSYVPKLIEKGIGDFVERLLRRMAFAFEDIQYYAIHPGAKKILEVCEQALNIDPRCNVFSYEVLRNYGNMSSATILFVLKKLWESLENKDHDKNIFCCAFGPGLTLESMILNSYHVK